MTFTSSRSHIEPAGGGALVVQRIETEEALGALREDWVRLESSSGNTLPLRTFAWVSSWWKHLSENRLVLKDALERKGKTAPPSLWRMIEAS